MWQRKERWLELLAWTISEWYRIYSHHCTGSASVFSASHSHSSFVAPLRDASPPLSSDYWSSLVFLSAKLVRLMFSDSFPHLLTSSCKHECMSPGFSHIVFTFSAFIPTGVAQILKSKFLIDVEIMKKSDFWHMCTQRPKCFDSDVLWKPTSCNFLESENEIDPCDLN